MASSTSESLDSKVFNSIYLFTGIEPEHIKVEYSLEHDLGIDSITLWEILTHLEVELGITDMASITEVSEEDFTSIKSVLDIMEYARRHTL